MEIGHVKFIRPQSPLLRKWIKGYYVHSSDDPNFYSKVTFYQNITTTISIYKDSVTSAEGRNRKQHYKKGNGFHSLLVGLVDKYQQVEFYGPLNRLAIVFYPCGINHFIREPLGAYLEKHFSQFNYFQDDFVNFLPKVYGEPSLEVKRDYLDAFFINRFKLLNEPKLLSCVEHLLNRNEVMKVGALAEELGINRRTLLRKFKTHLGYSVEEYITIIKFRKALLNFQQNKAVKKLSTIALDSKYYDQADFNHHIKFRSDLTPTELFKQLNIIDNTLFWKL